MTKQLWRKKPVVVEAWSWEGKTETASEIIDWILSNGGTAGLACGDECCEGRRQIRISTLEGSMYADPGDVIIRGVAGEFYPCDPDIFLRTYERVNV